MMKHIQTALSVAILWPLYLVVSVMALGYAAKLMVVVWSDRRKVRVA